jgi:hypothetical protein
MIPYSAQTHAVEFVWFLVIVAVLVGIAIWLKNHDRL